MRRKQQREFTAEELAIARAEDEAQLAWAEAHVAAWEAEHPDEQPVPIRSFKIDVSDIWAAAQAAAKAKPKA
jgi:hypothetical protein